MQQPSPSTSDSGSGVTKASPPSWPVPDEDVLAALTAAYRDGSWGRYDGPHGRRMMERLQAMHRAAEVLLCSSGTIAVELALRGLKVGPGDEVILAGYDFPGNFRAIEAIGARPVLVDLAAGTWTIDAEQVALAAAPESKAVIVSHLHGSMADMPRLRQIADERGWTIVEDACQTPGAIVAGKPAGAWGDCGVFSFGGSKLLTAGRGGAIVTNRDDVLQRIKIFCERGNDAFPLSELQAAVLIPQLPRLAAENAQRLRAVRQLLAACGQLPGIQKYELPEDASNEPAFYKLPWLLRGNDDRCDSPEFEQKRRRFIEALRAEGVAMDEGFRGFARRTRQRCLAVGDLPQARAAAASTVLLHHPVLLESAETLDRVALAIAKTAHHVLSR